MASTPDDSFDVFVVGLDAPPEQVTRNLQHAFGVNEQIAHTLVRNMPSRVKANVDADRAAQFADAFRATGAQVEIRPAGRHSPAGAPVVAQPASAPEQPAPLTPVAQLEANAEDESARVSRSAAERKMCVRHPQMTAIGTCVSCNKTVCARCSRAAPSDRRMCTPCVDPLLRARRKHLAAESDLVILSALHLFAAFVLAVLSVVWFAFVTGGRLGIPLGLAIGGLGLPMLILVGIEVCIAEGLRRMRPWVWMPALVFACWGSLLVPFGTIPNVLLARLLLSEHGRAIFSPSYRDVVALTPELHHRTSRAGMLATTFVILSLVSLGLGGYYVLR